MGLAENLNKKGRLKMQSIQKMCLKRRDMYKKYNKLEV
jgi:hypothetical protein